MTGEERAARVEEIRKQCEGADSRDDRPVLLAELNRVTKERDEWQNLSTALEHKNRSDNAYLIKERDAAIARAEKAEQASSLLMAVCDRAGAERDALRVQLDRLMWGNP